MVDLINKKRLFIKKTGNWQLVIYQISEIFSERELVTCIVLYIINISNHITYQNQTSAYSDAPKNLVLKIWDVSKRFVSFKIKIKRLI